MFCFFWGVGLDWVRCKMDVASSYCVEGRFVGRGRYFLQMVVRRAEDRI